MCEVVMTCSPRYRKSNGGKFGAGKLFVVFGFSQPCPDLDEIRVLEV